MEERIAEEVVLRLKDLNFRQDKDAHISPFSKNQTPGAEMEGNHRNSERREEVERIDSEVLLTRGANSRSHDEEAKQLAANENREVRVSDFGGAIKNEDRIREDLLEQMKSMLTDLLTSQKAAVQTFDATHQTPQQQVREATSQTIELPPVVETPREFMSTASDPIELTGRFDMNTSTSRKQSYSVPVQTQEYKPVQPSRVDKSTTTMPPARCDKSTMAVQELIEVLPAPPQIIHTIHTSTTISEEIQSKLEDIVKRNMDHQLNTVISEVNKMSSLFTDIKSKSEAQEVQTQLHLHSIPVFCFIGKKSTNTQTDPLPPPADVAQESSSAEQQLQRFKESMIESHLEREVHPLDPRITIMVDHFVPVLRQLQDMIVPSQLVIASDKQSESMGEKDACVWKSSLYQFFEHGSVDASHPVSKPAAGSLELHPRDQQEPAAVQYRYEGLLLVPHLGLRQVRVDLSR